MSVYRRSQALVLKRENVGEWDRRYVFFTALFGKLAVMARGTHKITSKLAGQLEPPQLVDLTFVAGRNTNTLIGGDSRQVFWGIRHRAERLAQVGFINETLLGLMEHDHSDQTVWELAVSVYQELDQSRMVSPLLGAFFVIRLLSLLGLAPSFERDASTGARLEQRDYRFSLPRGGLVSAAAASDSVAVSVSGVKALRLFQRGELATVRRLRAPLGVSQEVSRLAVQLLIYHRPQTQASLAVIQSLNPAGR